MFKVRREKKSRKDDRKSFCCLRSGQKKDRCDKYTRYDHRADRGDDARDSLNRCVEVKQMKERKISERGWREMVVVSCLC